MTRERIYHQLFRKSNLLTHFLNSHLTLLSGYIPSDMFLTRSNRLLKSQTGFLAFNYS